MSLMAALDAEQDAPRQRAVAHPQDEGQVGQDGRTQDEVDLPEEERQPHRLQQHGRPEHPEGPEEQPGPVDPRDHRPQGQHDDGVEAGDVDGRPDELPRLAGERGERQEGQGGDGRVGERQMGRGGERDGVQAPVHQVVGAQNVHGQVQLVLVPGAAPHVDQAPRRRQRPDDRRHRDPTARRRGAGRRRQPPDGALGRTGIGIGAVRPGLGGFRRHPGPVAHRASRGRVRTRVTASTGVRPWPSSRVRPCRGRTGPARLRTTTGAAWPPPRRAGGSRATADGASPR